VLWSFPDGVGILGGSVNHFRNGERKGGGADPVPRIRKQRLTHPPTSMTAPADTSRDVSNLMLVEARSTIPGGRSREGFGLLVCLRLGVFLVGGFCLAPPCGRVGGGMGVTRRMGGARVGKRGMCRA